ncbi:MAG: hypothetical protein J6Y78_14700 [Paludibacteraceae bacterium]|nr:hypothetical protein [Paludibacteraceae bacterium]
MNVNDYITIHPYTKSIEEWMEDMVIPAGERGQIAGADVVVLPFGYKDCEQAFTTSVYDFLAYARERSLFKIEVCCPEEGFTELELCSAKKRLGKFLLASTITGTIFWGVVSDYIYDQAKPILPQFSLIENVRTPQYLEAPEVSFSIVIPDSLGNKQEITYDGPLDGIEKVGEIIKTLTNGNESELHTGEVKE